MFVDQMLETKMQFQQAKIVFVDEKNTISKSGN